ncbi:30S ribosomal protein S1, partial [Eubacteriales bacterium OttesenSCG-928-M02]|nr:30S ribosomal protein S1 [Eubacteriales bacterium OttesenSCG-928-M02]
PVEEQAVSEPAEEAEAAPVQAENAAESTAEEETLSDEESFERDMEKTMVRIRPGQVKTGTVVSIVGDDVYVNIGYKADGIIHQKELSLDADAVASEMFQVGDEVQVEIIRVNDGEGNVLLSKRKVDMRQKEREAIAELEDGQPFEVTVKQAVKGGLLAEFLTARVFIPASHVAERYVENIEEFVGQKMQVKALEVDKNRKRIVASRREQLKAEVAQKRKELYTQFEAGSRVKGIVRRLTDFGAFTDIGGVDGLIHVTDLSWGRVRHPEDIVKVGDEVEVEILSVNPETERIALGYKQLQPKPWDTAMERYVPGDIIEGRVDRMAPFGAFVEIEPGLFGLVHISQVATHRIEKVEDELQVGDVITIKVLDINPETKRISLSRRAVLQEARTQQMLEEREQNRGGRNQNDEERFQYTIPAVEETTFTLGDLFPQMDAGTPEEVVEEVEIVVEEAPADVEESNGEAVEEAVEEVAEVADATEETEAETAAEAEEDEKEEA